MSRNRRPDFAPGDLPPGAKVLEIKLPKLKRKPCPLLEPGSILTHFTVDGRASPWRAPTVTRSRGAFKGRLEREWSRKVATAARQAFATFEPYEGPIELRLSFYLTRRSGPLPDLTNLIKSTEDSMQGIIYKNDRQVCSTIAVRVVADFDETRIQVFALEKRRS